MNKAFNAVDAGRQDALNTYLLRLIEQFNRTTDGAMVMPSEYLEAAIRTR